MASVDDYVASIVSSVEAADREAHASSLAWQLGPDVFLDHLKRRNEIILARMNKEYADASPDYDPEFEREDHGDRSGTTGGGSGASPEGSGSVPETDSGGI